MPNYVKNILSFDGDPVQVDRLFVCRKPLARRVVPKKASADDEDRKTPFVVK